MLNPKELKKLASACRKAGIKSYKCSDFEFTLTDDAPIAPVKHKTMLKVQSGPAEIVSDKEVQSEQELTEEQLLMWSTGNTERDFQ